MVVLRRERNLGAGPIAIVMGFALLVMVMAGVLSLTNAPEREMVLGLLAILCLVAVLVKPMLGFYVLTAVLIAVSELDFGLFILFGVHVYITDLLFAAILLAWLVRLLAGKSQLPRATMNMPMAIFLGYLMVVMTVSIIRSAGAQGVFNDARATIYYALYFPTLALFRDMRQVSRLMVWMLLILGATALFGIWATFAGVDIAHTAELNTGEIRRVYQSTGAGIFVSAMPFLAVGLMHLSPPWQRRLIMVSVFASVILLTIQMARGVWLGFLGGLLFLVVSLARIDRNRVLVSVAAGVLLLASAALASQFSTLPGTRMLDMLSEVAVSIVDPERSSDVVALSAAGRVSEWEMAFQLTEDRPFTGYGLGRWMPAFGRGLEWLGGEVFQLHSAYANQLMKTGYPGLLLFLGVAFYFLSRVIKIALRAPDPKLSSLAFGIAAAYLSIMISSMTGGFILISKVVVPWIAIMMGMTMVLERSISGPDTVGSAPEVPNASMPVTPNSEEGGNAKHG
ncbi:MAG: O-antigen ligase family protein [Chloroflexi bacterium]|nr:O-antigen ligase family protein [Chloroflexota bacterium]MCL5026420.1 O-antigen ligase family protein [Chloroflexota bacterium]